MHLGFVSHSSTFCSFTKIPVLSDVNFALTVELTSAVIVPLCYLNNERALDPVSESTLAPALQITYIASGSERKLL